MESQYQGVSRMRRFLLVVSLLVLCPVFSVFGQGAEHSVLMPERNYFNVEGTVYKDLEVGVSVNFSWFLIGANVGYDIWHETYESSFTSHNVIHTGSWDNWSPRTETTTLSSPFHWMVYGGIFLNYFSVDCGFGYYFGTAKKGATTSGRYFDSSGKYYLFTFRPQVKAYLPFTGNRHWIFSLGYNFVDGGNMFGDVMDGLTLSVGLGMAF